MPKISGKSTRYKPLVPEVKKTLLAHAPAIPEQRDVELEARAVVATVSHWLIDGSHWKQSRLGPIKSFIAATCLRAIGMLLDDELKRVDSNDRLG